MKQAIFYILAILLIPVSAVSQDVNFTASAPSTVVQDSRFQLVYTINQEAGDLRVPDLKDFQILMGPTTSQRSQVQIISGKVSREQEFSYTYILKANNKGTFTIPPATMEVDGKKYESNALTIEVIEGDPAGSPATGESTPAPDAGTISDDDLFITMIADSKRFIRANPYW